MGRHGRVLSASMDAESSMQVFLDRIVLRQPCVSLAPPPLGPPVHSAPHDSDDQSCDSAGGDWTRGAVWRGGEEIGRLLLESPEIVRGRRVIELGTGTGIAGLAAAAAGASAVLLTDQLLSQARVNVGLNPRLSERVQLLELRWGTDSAARTQLDEARRLGPWDVTIAADVVYPASEAALPARLHTARALGDRALIGYVEREAATTARLHSELRALCCRCVRRRLAPKAFLYTLSDWCDAGGPAAKSTAGRAATGSGEYGTGTVCVDSADETRETLRVESASDSVRWTHSI
jgi:predicted nicotinamide N-methyase